jgi:cobalt-zinc-cadmium efflux system membrane fusion protein
MKSSSRLASVVALGVASSLALACGGCHASKASEPAGTQVPPGQVWLTAAQVSEGKIEVAPVAEQDVDDTITTSGTITLDDLRTGHVFTPVTGKVVKITAQLGDRVKKGDTLASIESPDIGTSVSDVHKAEADLIAATHEYQRKKDLYAEQAASAADVEQAEDAERNAKAELERARQKQFLLHVGNVDIVTGTYTLTSPIEGEVLMRNINPGIEVQGQYSGGAMQELFTIGELDRVWVLGDIYEIDLARVHVGEAAAVTVVAYPGKTFNGTVDWLSGSLDPVTRTAKVRCTFDNPDRLLRPMMYTTMQIAVEQRKAVAIPPSALMRLGEYKVVFLQVGEADGKVHYERVPVDIDERSKTGWLEVKHGLDAGQKLVIKGADVLSQKL